MRIKRAIVVSSADFWVIGNLEVNRVYILSWRKIGFP